MCCELLRIAKVLVAEFAFVVRRRLASVVDNWLVFAVA